ncbi:RelA/SpoT family protein [Candidatus Latescibacterota bacterium]
MADKQKKTKKTSLNYTIEPVELVEVMDEFSILLEKIEEYNPNVDKDLIRRALRFAAVAHAGQYRKTGKPFIHHGIQTALILTELHLGSVMIACGLLHDVVEDTPVSIEEVEKEFGEEIANIISGLTKIAGLKLKSREEQQAENFRKMILHTARDPRTILVKFADRLHNMRTLEFLPPEKRKRISHETLEVFAPLAHRFGIHTIKTEFEDLAFKFLYPEEFEKLSREIENTHKERDDYLDEFFGPIKERLVTEKIDYKLQWRLKHLYSIFNKMNQEHKRIDEIYDIFAVRIIVNTIADCYHILGIIHSIHTPMIARIKDFIATPKFNMYQSLHTTVVGNNGRLVEFQIRTSEMHQTAETGIAAHWRYKEGNSKPDEIDSFIAWLSRMVDWQKGTPEASEFMHELKMDLFQDEIFVFTPNGDLTQLPAGSTPVDFAFALHSEIGLHCSGAKVNDRIAPLDSELHSGQWIHILTNPNKTPNPEWLNFVKTAKARSLIRRWFKRQRHEESKELGIGMIAKIEKQIGEKISESVQQKIVRRFHQSSWDQFLAGLGLGDISFHSVKNFFGLTAKSKKEKPEKAPKSKVGVAMQGVENLLVNYAKCCKPLPGDDIIGFITRGRGLIVHRSDCENLNNLAVGDQRIIQVKWETKEDLLFVASIRVDAKDRKGLLSDITAAISKSNCDIRAASVSTKDEIATDDFDVDVKSLADLNNLMKDVRNVKGVLKVKRLDMRSPDSSVEK